MEQDRFGGDCTRCGLIAIDILHSRFRRANRPPHCTVCPSCNAIKQPVENLPDATVLDYYCEKCGTRYTYHKRLKRITVLEEGGDSDD
jgi:ssDNA-binding Zn-finger/Zn-ribbon topoisomerase 1